MAEKRSPEALHFGMPTELELQFQAHADELMKTVVIALFANPNRPRLVGSAFLVAFKTHIYLVSARHVFEEMNVEGTGLLFFYVGLDQVYVPTGRLLFTKNDAHGQDDDDVAVMKLGASPPVWSGSEFKRPIALEALGDNVIVDEDSYLLLAGYPASRARIHSPTSRMVAQPHGFSRPRASDDHYKSFGIDPNSHILVRFDQRRDISFVGMEGAPSRFPSPAGMSGAPLWRVSKDGNGHIRTTIVGIATTHLKTARLIKSTHIDCAIAMIAYLDSVD